MSSPVPPQSQQLQNSPNPFLRQAVQKYMSKRGVVAQPQETTRNKPNAASPAVNKMKWDVMQRMPGNNGWDKMKVVNKGLSPLTGKTAAALSGIPFGNTLAHIGSGISKGKDKVLSLGESISNSTKRIHDPNTGLFTGNTRTPLNSADYSNPHIKALIDETNGQFQFTNGKFFPAFMRAGGGYTLGGAMEGDEGDGTGALMGMAAGLAGPSALRLLADKNAPKGGIRHLLSDDAVRRRLVNDPLMRIGMTAGAGEVADMGASVLGYDDVISKHKFRNLGIGAGLLGGLRPAAQLAASKSQTAAALMDRWGNNRVGKFLGEGQVGGKPWVNAAGKTVYPSGWGHTGGLLQGTPYVAAGSPAAAGLMMGGQMFGLPLVTEPAQQLMEKKQMLTEAAQAPEVQKMMQTIKPLFEQMYGAGTKMTDSTGLPTAEAIQFMRQITQYAIMQARNVGQRYFGDESFVYNPQNWETLSSPMSAVKAFAQNQWKNMTTPNPYSGY
jgi:hypothetical protein